GVTLSSIDVIHTPGNVQSTGVNTDLAIQGNGFFILSDGLEEYYTRAGNFHIDDFGNLVYSNGLYLQGWLADATGAIDTGNQLGRITLPVGSTVAPQMTEWISLSG